MKSSISRALHGYISYEFSAKKTYKKNLMQEIALLKTKPNGMVVEAPIVYFKVL